MTYIRSLDDTYPPARFDGVAFTTAIIQEAPEVAGAPGSFSTIDTKTLTPADSNPAQPMARDLTTTLATLTTAWYRIIWQDGAAAQFIGDPVRYPPGNAADLCTLAEVRDMEQIPVGETEQDTIRQVLITGLSKAITRYCRREFVPTAAATRDLAHVLRPSGGGFFDLDPYDLRTLTAISAGPTGATLTTISVADVRLWTSSPGDGVYQGIEFSRSVSIDRGNFDSAVVRVAGDWGFLTVPEDVRTAAKLAVAIWMKRDVSNFSTTLSLDTTRIERPEAIPSAARFLLNGFRRVPYAG